MRKPNRSSEGEKKTLPEEPKAKRDKYPDKGVRGKGGCGAVCRLQAAFGVFWIPEQILCRNRPPYSKFQ